MEVPLLLLLLLVCAGACPLVAMITAAILRPKRAAEAPACAHCGYSLVGLEGASICPECGYLCAGTESGGRARSALPGAVDAWRWARWAGAASLLSHGPACFLWVCYAALLDAGVMSIVLFYVFVQAAVVAWSVAILARTGSRELVLAGAVALTGGQFVIELGQALWLMAHPPIEYEFLAYGALPLMGWFVTPGLLVIACVVGGIIQAVRRRRGS